MRPRGESGLNENLGAIPSSVAGSSLISGASEAEDTCSVRHSMPTQREPLDGDAHSYARAIKPQMLTRSPCYHPLVTDVERRTPAFRRRLVR